MAKIIADDGRDPLARIADRALLLLGVEFGQQVGRVDEFRLMKIPFVTQHKLSAEGIVGFSHRYYKYTHGPISNSIYADRDVLLGAGLLEGDKGGRLLTDLGRRLARVVQRELKGNDYNERVIGVLKDQARWIAGEMSWEPIKEKVYAFEIGVVGEDDPMTVADAPHASDLEFLSTGLNGEFTLPEHVSIAVSLACSMTPEFIKAASTDSGLSVEQVFAA